LKYYGYDGIDDLFKVHHLLKGINTTELDVCKTQVMASPSLRDDFSATVGIYSTFSKHMKAENPQLNVYEAIFARGNVKCFKLFIYHALTTDQKNTMRPKLRKCGHPELDEIPELDPTRANFNQSQIGIMCWCVELVHIEFITELPMLPTYLFLPREGHLEAVFHVFTYLGLHHNERVVFGPTYPDVDMGTFIKTDWKSMYVHVKEMIPSDALFPHVKEVDLRLFVDSDNDGE
jgi:hypothetical protein